MALCVENQKQSLPEIVGKKGVRKYMNSSLRLKIFKRDGGVCSICGRATRFFWSNYDSPFSKHTEVAGSVDHILPVSKGGTIDEGNLRLACRSCNCSRGNRT